MNNSIDQNQINQKLFDISQKNGVPPELIIKAGDFARATLKNRVLYPVFVQAMIGLKLADPGELPAQFNTKVLSQVATAGKIISQKIGAI